MFDFSSSLKLIIADGHFVQAMVMEKNTQSNMVVVLSTNTEFKVSGKLQCYDLHIYTCTHMHVHPSFHPSFHWLLGHILATSENYQKCLINWLRDCFICIRRKINCDLYGTRVIVWGLGDVNFDSCLLMEPPQEVCKHSISLTWMIVMTIMISMSEQLPQKISCCYTPNTNPWYSSR